MAKPKAPQKNPFTINGVAYASFAEAQEAIRTIWADYKAAIRAYADATAADPPSLESVGGD